MARCDSKKDRFDCKGNQRTLGTLRTLFWTYYDDGAVKLKEKHHGNVVHPPLFCCKPDDTSVISLVPPPELHLLTGPVSTIFSVLKKLWPQADEWQICCVIQRECLHGGRFTGNASRKLANVVFWRKWFREILPSLSRHSGVPKTSSTHVTEVSCNMTTQPKSSHSNYPIRSWWSQSRRKSMPWFFTSLSSAPWIAIKVLGHGASKHQNPCIMIFYVCGTTTKFVALKTIPVVSKCCLLCANITANIMDFWIVIEFLWTG